MNRKLFVTLAISCTALLLHAPTALATNLFAAPAGVGDACTQAAPCASGTALGKAVAGDAVWLAAGTYAATAGAPAVTVPTSLVLLGGWSGTTTAPPVRDPLLHVTILDGAGVNRGVVVASGVTALLNGLTVRGGRHAERGGGIEASGADLTLRNVIVEENAVIGDAASEADTHGGGLAMSGGSLRVVDSIFRRNAASGGKGSSHGGGIYASQLSRLEVRGSTFDRNDAYSASGISSNGSYSEPHNPVVIDSCSFVGNGTAASVVPRLGDLAGAISLTGSDATVTGSTFSGNYAYYLTASFSYGDLVFDRNLVTDNDSDVSPAVRLSAGEGVLTNNLFVRNTASVSSPLPAVGVLVDGSTGTVAHNTIVGPAGGAGHGIRVVGSAQVHNNVLARLGTGLRAEGTGSVVVTNNLWGSGAWANLIYVNADAGVTLDSHDNVIGDPAFADGAGGDFHLLAGSAARGIGAQLGGVGARDLDGLPHQTPVPDAGVYEYAAALTLGFPRGGERLHSGDLSVVRWGAPEAAVSFDVFLSLNDGQTWLPQGAGVVGRSLEVGLPTVKRALTKCRVKVVARDGAGARIGKAVSGRFAVEPLTLVAPAAGAVLTGGSEYFVRWDSHRLARRVAKVKVAYSLDGGATWKSALPAAIKFDPGMARWALPSPGADKPRAKVKVTLFDKAGATIGSAVSGEFTLAKP